MNEPERGSLVDYRGSHAEPGYGLRYSRTYEVGYYAQLWRQIERPLLERRLDEIVGTGMESALDFACGTGRITSVLCARFKRVLGADVSEAMLEVAREQCPAAEFRQLDLTINPLPETFGLVTAFRFFLNAEPALRSAAMEALCRVLEPRGFLIANVHVTRSSPLGMAYRIRNRLRQRIVANTLATEELVQLGKQHGLEVLHVDQYGYLPRIGRLTDGALLRAMMPVERLFQAVPALPRSLAQAALVTFQRR